MNGRRNDNTRLSAAVQHGRLAHRRYLSEVPGLQRMVAAKIVRISNPLLTPARELNLRSF
jgi:hypothetical protein